ncbi:MAG: NAD(+)/NADH kinase [Bdellovibrionia bacterium]
MGKSFKRIGILHRSDRKEAREFSKKTADWLTAKDCEVFSILSPIPKVRQAKALGDLDLIVVVGGDGTYLQAVRLLQGRPVPVMGANFGHTGFLTETMAEELFTVLEKALKGKASPQKRSMLSVTVKGKPKSKVDGWLALNDVVVERGANTHLIDLSVFLGEQLVTRFRADGLIVATPTGSTAYNLSASGPIVHPEVPAVVVTPVAPHSLTARSITLPDSEAITIRMHPSDRTALLMVDGQNGGEVDSGHEIRIEKAADPHIMLSSTDYDYFERLNAKLQFGQRT